MADVFISYAQGDRAWVKGLAGALESEGFSVWWDPNLLPGARFREIIKEQLAEAKAVIVVWSHLSVGSDWVLGEADEARVLQKLIPILREEIRPPHEFRGIHTADLGQWQGSPNSPEFRSIVSALRRLSPAGASSDDAAGKTLSASALQKRMRSAFRAFSEQIEARSFVLTVEDFVLAGAVLVLIVLLVGTVYLRSDSWKPTLETHIRDTIAQADDADAEALKNISIAFDAQTDAQKSSKAAEDAAQQAGIAAQKAKANTPGYSAVQLPYSEAATFYYGEVTVSAGLAQPNGYGVYDGEWRDDADEFFNHYSGQWKKGERDGFGIAIEGFSNTKYEGSWSRDNLDSVFAIISGEARCEGRSDATSPNGICSLKWVNMPVISLIWTVAASVCRPIARKTHFPVNGTLTVAPPAFAAGQTGEYGKVRLMVMAI